jgi:hypothetical protein
MWQSHEKDCGRAMAGWRQVVRYALVCWMLAIGLCPSGCTSGEGPSSVTPSWQPAAEAVAHPHGLPQIGKWMFGSQYEPAHWLGELHRGKPLREPINIIILDAVAQSAEDARSRLLHSCAAAGYPVREGHSTGYRGYIDGVVYEQLPDGKNAALSNEPFERHNNHGRMFGPHPYQGAWLFIGAFSRERVDLLEKVRHRFVSFNQARDDLAQRLDMKTDFKIKAFIDLDNALIGDPGFTNGDHDGIAVLLTASEP